MFLVFESVKKTLNLRFF